MFDRFSNAVGRLLFLARLEAGRLKFNEIDTAHFLLAFIDDDQGTGALESPEVYVADDDEPITANVVLKRHSDSVKRFLNPDVAASLRLLLLTTGPRGEAQSDNVDMMLSERAQLLLANAADFAGDHTVTPLHLFWAMLGEEQGEVANYLSQHGFTRPVIEKMLKSR